jgi:hypothetical protein
MSRRWITSLVALAAVVVVAGCGDDESTTATGESASATMSKQQYVKAADAACQKLGARLNAELTKASQDSSGSFTEALSPLLVDTQEELAELGAPSGDEEAIEELNAALEEAAVKLRADQSEGIAAILPALNEFTKLSRAYGLKLCAEL